jgi:gamma-glutamylcyclotransferase (GGCT)/AIG2-like uncharacterized protein YtfP
MTDPVPIHLFSYGTLRQPEVQQSSFGRLLVGSEDALPGYRTTLLEITDPDVLAVSGERFHPIVERSPSPGDEVPGMVFEITEAELLAADSYEVSDYGRISVTLKSGIRAWVYTSVNESGDAGGPKPEDPAST